MGWWFQKKKPLIPAILWPLDMPLFDFGVNNTWYLLDAFNGLICLGSTGSGKTSAVAMQLLLTFLCSQFGMLVLTTKMSDRAFIERLARIAGREKDLVVFGQDHPENRVNLLDDGLSQQTGSANVRVENIVQLIKIMLEIGERDPRSGQSSGDNKYFERAALQLVRSAILVLVLANEVVSLENIHRLILSLARSIEETTSAVWREGSYCYQTLCRADDRFLSPSEMKDFVLTLLYLMKEFPAMDPEPRGSIVSTYSTMVDMLQRGLIRDTFFSDTTFDPIRGCRDGKIIILDYPTLLWNEVGRIIQALFKYVWQRGQLRFDVNTNPRPVVLFCDEVQQFLTSYDAIFQSVARSSRICTFGLSQNLPCLYEAVGGEVGRHIIDGWLGNLRTKIFLHQDDPTTCQWQSELVGKTKRLLFNSNSQPQQDLNFDWRRSESNVSAGFSEAWEPEVQPWEWSRGLRTGSATNGYQVDAYVVQGGRVWNSTGKPYVKVAFNQKEI